MYRPILKCVIAVALLGSAQLASAAAPTGAAPSGKQVGIITILEGRATVIRGLSQFDAQEGARLLPNDLVRTDDSGFLRLEYPDQTWLELGPQTTLQLSHPGQKKPAARPGPYLLEGWLKLGCPKEASSSCSLTSKDVDVADLTGTVIVRTTKTDSTLFAEAATARLTNRGLRGATPLNLNAGDFVMTGPGKPVSVQKRPTADFLAALPRPYRDTLPSRYSLFEARAVTPPAQRPFSYVEVEPWLNAEAPVRRQFVVLWHRKALEPGFREPLDRDLALHPEWDRTLHPEKYEITEPTPTGPAERQLAPAAQPVPKRGHISSIKPDEEEGK
jgi:hypothetical protein